MRICPRLLIEDTTAPLIKLDMLRLTLGQYTRHQHDLITTLLTLKHIGSYQLCLKLIEHAEPIQNSSSLLDDFNLS